MGCGAGLGCRRGRADGPQMRVETGKGPFGRDRLTLRRLDQQVLEGEAVRGRARAPGGRDPCGEAAVLRNARGGGRNIALAQISHISEAAKPHFVRSPHAGGCPDERLDQPIVGLDVLGEPAVAGCGRAGRLGRKRPVIGGLVRRMGGGWKNARPGQLGQRAFEPGQLMGRHQETPGALTHLLLVIGQGEQGHRLAAQADGDRTRRRKDILGDAGAGPPEVARLDAAREAEAQERSRSPHPSGRHHPVSDGGGDARQPVDPRRPGCTARGFARPAAHSARR